MLDILQLCDIVRQTSFEIHCYLKHGHFEKVYERALVHRLRKLGIVVDAQVPLQVLDEDGFPLGDYNTDVFVDNRLVVEIKAVHTLIEKHTALILGYLRAAKQQHGMLINFGSPRLQVRKFIL
ncbi:MAG: hypothetical protein A2X67_11560 [Ignavibacteria bacterium GWA2_55_11]|nr:MAG: hypothetical protein A2X67_11560 [Ignavibacteria bacterium GWA2_55_11]OGU46456.1 MAG: hypothetical protein A2X68_04420 [Ignavibacteria bacterium GWC2_56_12]HAV23344.1 GxxExxY protein [Bacteroidota bacterium]